MMTKAAGLLVFPLLLSPLSPFMKGSADASQCADTIVYGTRDVSQAPGEGLVGFGPQAAHLSQAIKAKGSVDYVANSYSTNVTQGVTAMVEQVSTIAATCEKSDLVTIGYGQGSVVTKVALSKLEENPELTNKIKFVLLIADPSRNKAEENIIHLDKGGVTAPQGSQTKTINNLNTLTGKTYSVCFAKDATCSSTAQNPTPQAYLTNSLAQTISRLSALPPVQTLTDVNARRIG